MQCIIRLHHFNIKLFYFIWRKPLIERYFDVRVVSLTKVIGVDEVEKFRACLLEVIALESIWDKVLIIAVINQVQIDILVDDSNS